MIRDPGLSHRVVILFVMAVAATQSCSAGGSNVGTNPRPALTISINPARATVSPGKSVDIRAELIGSGGFTGAGAAFGITGAPTGVTVTVSQLQPGSVTTAIITASVAAAVPPGRYGIILIGAGTGVIPVSASFELTVPVPSIAISVNPTSTVVTPGGSVAIGATLTGSGGFRGAGAAFAMTGAPTGVTFAVSNLQTSDSVTTATITTSVPPTIPLGTYALVLTGSGSGVNAVAVPVLITVAEACFSLAVNPAAFTLVPEDAASSTITINRTSGFTGSVALSASSSGGRFWMLFDPTSTTGNSSIMTTGTSGPSQTYTLTITGAAPGCVSQTVTIAVTVP